MLQKSKEKSLLHIDNDNDASIICGERNIDIPNYFRECSTSYENIPYFCFSILPFITFFICSYSVIYYGCSNKFR
mgnify:CR=1 FL=1